MAGNLEEWVQDWYSATYYASAPPVDPLGPTGGATRVTRGAGWLYGVPLPKSSTRTSYGPETIEHGIGFRIVRSSENGPRIQTSRAKVTTATSGPEVFINQIRVGAVADVELENCQVQFDANGDLHIHAPEYKLVAPPEQPPERIAPPPTPSPA